jgi:hypothetical protein
MADLEEKYYNPDFNHNLWSYFTCRSQIVNDKDGDIDKYEAKFDRCQRIVDKKDTIFAEIRANKRRLMDEWGFRRPDLSGLSAADIAAIRRRGIEKFRHQLKEHQEMRKRKLRRKAANGNASARAS